MPSGLDGVVVADTEMSHVDGERGLLWIRGRTVRELARRGRLEEAMALLWGGSEEQWRAELGQARARMWPAVQGAPSLPEPDATAGMRALLAGLEGAQPCDLVAAAGLFVAAFCGQRQGRTPLAPSPELPHADDLVRMIHGAPDPARALALGRYLCTVVDHSMNASTFVARVIASTGSDPTSAVVGALGALKGPLHGGAPGPVLDMLDAIGTPERAEAFLQEELAAGRRIMGMGHRIYRVRDPRVEVLEEAISELSSASGGSPRLQLAREVERAAEAALRSHKPDRPLKANVEFATAVLLEAVGLPREAFTAMFAAGRIVGWLAHVEEQRKTGRLIRPSSSYVGPVPATEGPPTSSPRTERAPA
jgi:citrate synthase